ncbi:MAG: hypothetical protein Q8S44_07310 [Flavobacteriaceae bacterium]|nr:hypothetical protein [Flavobacteriaceae bacterium]
MNSPLDPRESLLRLGAKVLDALFEAEKFEAQMPDGALDYIHKVGGPPTPAQLEHFTDHFFGGDPMKTLIMLAEFRIAQDKLQMLSDQYVTLRAALELNEAGRANIDPDRLMDIFGVDDGIRSPAPHWEPKASPHDQLPDFPRLRDEDY